MVSAASLEIQRRKLLLARARRDAFGQTSERSKRLLDQLELQLAAARGHCRRGRGGGRSRDRLGRNAGGWPPSAEVGTSAASRASAAPAGRDPGADVLPLWVGTRLSKVGEAVTETLDVIPRRWFVRQTVREKFSCRDCEKISEPPAPIGLCPIPRRGVRRGEKARRPARPDRRQPLAMILFEKCGQHQPLNRQSERYARAASAAVTALARPGPDRSRCDRWRRPRPVDAGRSCRHGGRRPGAAP